ncbi:hypothetical protein CRN79_09090 [Serratia fonticola]|nr:hypothetical protein CRN79_09090 [Serratia fonticola]
MAPSARRVLCRGTFRLKPVIPFIFQATALLAAYVNPSHLLCISSWGLTYLPPGCGSKSIGYVYLTYGKKNFRVTKVSQE